MERTCKDCKHVFTRKKDLARHLKSGACRGGATFRAQVVPHFGRNGQNHKKVEITTKTEEFVSKEPQRPLENPETVEKGQRAVVQLKEALAAEQKLNMALSDELEKATKLSVKRLSIMNKLKA